jgi:osmotically-inducible protein OsmY
VSKPAISGGETPATSATGKATTGNTGKATTENTDTEPVRPDNSGVNKRDQDPAAVLPTEQGNNQKDLDISAEIRRKILQNKEISVNGQNVKTPTVGGKVTLRGPVASDEERKLIEQIAKDVAGAENVTSELEVAP